MSSPYTIRLAGEDDAVAWRALKDASWLEVYPRPERGITVDDVAAYLQREYPPGPDREMRDRARLRSLEDRRDWVAFTSVGEMVGTVGARKHPDGRGEIANLYTLQRTYGTGLGQLLMDEAMAWLGERPLFLHVIDDNIRAKKFYMRYDFQEDELLPADYLVLPNGVSMLTRVMRRP
jgi:ribosomal protein S18 acetylase RimI-like enzyme